MEKVSVAEAKAQLSSLLDEVEQGEAVTITRHNVPVAELRPLTQANTGPRPWGLGKGAFVVPDNFNDPLLDAFEGRSTP